MSKKFTMLLMSLLCVVGVAKAGVVTDFPTMSEGENIKWYTISNTRSTSGKYLYWTESGVKDSNTRTGASFFYVTGSAEACYIHNYATNLLFSGNGAWTAEGVACNLSVSPNETGLMIGFNGTYLNEQNYDNGFTTWGDINDAGSIFVFEEVTDFSAIIDVPAAKNAAIAELNNLASVSVLYSTTTTDAVNAINAVTPASNGLKDLNDAVEAINAVVANYRNAAYQSLAGKYFTIKTPARGNGYMQMSTSKVVGSADVASPANIWQFVHDNGAVKVFNPYTGKYLCEPSNSNSVDVGVTGNVTEAGAYQLVVNASAENAEAKVKFTSNGKSVHMAGGSTLVRWDNGGASEWQVTEITDFSNVISLHRAAAIATLDEWTNYNLDVVFDAALIGAAKNAINGMNTDWETFAAIDAELVKVTDAIAARKFTFQTVATDSHRENVWVSANMSTEKAIGLHGESNYNSIWSLRHAGGVSFYLYNELNSVYMGKPSENCPLTENPAVAYTFEVIDAAKNIVEMKSNGETLHASNHNDDKLLSWDGDEDASRWMVNFIDVARDIQDLLDTIEESDYADVPALGQYPTAAYEALVAARNSAQTVEEVEHAIAAFKASLNKPVYIITSAWDGGYSAGSAIYYDGVSWKWKKANRYDRQMWMTIPGYTEEGVPAAVDAYDANNTSYGFCDYLTGTKIRGKEGVQLVKITGWPEAYSLQYAASGGDAAHHAQSGGALVNWHPALINDRQASAWTVEYLGNTYELKDLTNEQLAALTEAQAAFDSKIYLFDAVFGDGVGQYQGEEATIKGALFEVAPCLNLKLNVLKEKTVDEINAWTASINSIPAATINLPTEGYYRIYGANSNVTPAGQYITGHTNADGGRIALTNDADASTIYYYKDGKLQAYQSGKYIALSSAHFTFDAPAEGETAAIEASAIEFAASSYIAGAYIIKSADRYLHYKVYDGAVEIDRCQAEESANDSWFLEKLEKETITYTYKIGETVLATQEVQDFAGMPYPAANAVLPLGYTATALEGNVVKGETAKEIACEFNAEAIPFEYYDSYNKVEQWYYLNFAKEQRSLYYDADNEVLVVEETIPNKENCEAYAWAFIGDPLAGFQVVNKKAGATKGLKAMKNDALTGGVVGESAHTFKLTASGDFANGFYMAATNGETTDRFNSQSVNEVNQMVYWTSADAGSTFTVSALDFTTFVNVGAAKTAAVEALNSYALASDIYPTPVEEAITGVQAVVPASNDLVDLNVAVEKVNAIVENYRNAAYEALENKFFTIQTLTAERTKGYMQMSTVKVVGTAQAESPANLWQFVCSENGTVNIYNPYTKKYLCEPDNSNSVDVGVTSDAVNAGAYVLNVNVNAEVTDAKLKLTSNGKSVHMSGGSVLVRWDNGGASEWKVTEITDFSEVIENYKEVAILSMDEWKNLSVVFDANLIEEAETALQGITTTDWETFAAIDAELTKVTDAVAEKMFTFQTTATDNHRNGVWVSANATTGKAIGAVEQDYNAIWSLRHAGGVSFYLYNELNSVYMGKPSENCPLTENPAVAYTFEVVDAANNIVEMKSNGETLHASNHNDDKLLNWDGDEAASRWKIAVIDVTKDIKDLLATIDEDDYAEVPALGQYPTAAYNALVEAGNTAETVEEVEHAIAAFKASLNKPVYVITSAWDGGYSAGSAIYYDGAWKWKKANRYDRQMWMTIPGHTQEEAPFVNAYDENGTSYEVCDYLTGTVMRGKSVQFVQVPNWEGAYSLQYNANAASTDAAQHAQSGGNLVSWKPAILTDCQASAWRVEYLGNTYDLKDLTNEQLAALTEAQAAFDSKIYLFDAVFGDGVGQYQGEEATIKGALFEVAPCLNLKLNVLKEKTVDEINAWTASINSIPAATINLPTEGYYRIYGANSNVTPAGQYITGHTNADGGRIALTNDADASTIYYYKDGKLQAYQSGKYIAVNANHYTFDTPATEDKEAVEASAIEFAASSYIAGAYTIKSADRYLHYKVYDGAVEIDRCQAEESANDSWFLEKLEKETITYTYKIGETVLATQEVKEFAGMPYPAANAVLPLGYTKTTTLEGNIVKGETAKEIVCELNAEAIPFEYYDSYANVEQWYYLNFAKDQNYLYYDADNTVLDATQTKVDRKNRSAYAWAFIGTPATGFQVVNKLAGADKGLKALKSETLTGGVVGEGAHTFKLTASGDFTNGFYMAATNGESAERFNKQGGKMVYWGGADAGSTFTVAVCPFGPVAELEALIAEAEELKTIVDGNTGDKIGEYTQATANSLANALDVAKSKGDAATAADVTALGDAIDATKIVLPIVGTYYQLYSTVNFAETKAVYSHDGKALWKTLDNDDKSFYWKAVATEDGGVALMNANDEKYLQGNTNQSGAWTVSDEKASVDIKIFSKAENANGYQYGIVLNNWQMHANGHSNGSGTASNIVSWNTNDAGSASSWYIVPVELPTFYDIVYEFTYNGVAVEKFTQKAALIAGKDYPEVLLPSQLPYGISIVATTPEGHVTESKTFEFAFKVDEEFSLPFEAAATGEPTKWYYTQMHAYVGYGFYVSANDDNLVWHGTIEDAAKYIAEGANHDDYLWGFVGNIWDGFKMVNKAGKAVISTGDGAVTVGELANATAFKAWKSKAGGEWFCMKHPTTGDYLNLNSGKSIIDHWNENDNGSSILVTEPGKEESLEVASIGYSTYYSDRRLSIPESVKAYVVTSVENREVVLEQVTGIIPAHTGLILRGAGKHTFVASTDASTSDVSGNLLKGTTTKTLITPAEGYTCYVLANPAGGNGVGLYIASLNKDESGNEGNTHFYNNANKVYLPVENPVVEEESGQSARALRFRFGGEGTTEIEPSTLNSQPSTIIYDLTGRRINEIVEKGIYIVNGKKVVIR